MIALTLSRNPSDRPWEVRVTPSSYHEAVKDHFGAAPGCRWDRDAKCYVGPAEAVEPVLSRLEAAGVAVVKGDRHPARAVQGHLPQCPAEFREYQRKGASWLAYALTSTDGALLADEMGLGKSAQAIIAIEAADPCQGDAHYRVVCPAVVVPHWRAQIERWSRLAGAWADPISYEKFTREVKAGKSTQCDAIVFDEIHYLSSARKLSQRTAAAKKYLANCGPRPLVLGLSGTPMQAHPRDLWYPLELLHPGRWGSKWQFERRYCDGKYEELPHIDRAVWKAEGTSHLDELAARLKHVMLRRTKAEVAASLPPRTRIVHEVTLPANVRKTAAAGLTSGVGLTGDTIARLLGELEACKLGAAADLAREAMAAGEKVLLLTTRKASAASLGASLQCPVVDGDTAASERRDAIAGRDCAVATLYSLQVGVDLTEFTCVIFVGLDWLPSRILQAEARIHRLGQKRPVTGYFLVATDTLDEYVRDAVIERLDQFAEVVGQDADAGSLGAALGGTEEELLAGIIARCKA